MLGLQCKSPSCLVRCRVSLKVVLVPAGTDTHKVGNHSKAVFRYATKFDSSTGVKLSTKQRRLPVTRLCVPNVKREQRVRSWLAAQSNKERSRETKRQEGTQWLVSKFNLICVLLSSIYLSSYSTNIHEKPTIGHSRGKRENKHKGIYRLRYWPVPWRKIKQG